MTQLFRCSGGHHLAGPARESSKFLATVSERTLVTSFLSYPNPILEVFQRPPVTHSYQTRFGPPGLVKNPLYVASDTDTTFYEYGFHLLAATALRKQELKITCFELDINLDGVTSDPTGDVDANRILDRGTNYSSAHQWFAALSPAPEIVKYPSVRHPSANLPLTGMNFALYEKKSLKAVVSQTQLLMKLDSKHMRFEVYDMGSTQVAQLSPRY